MTRTIILSASALALSACAGKTPPPAIAYDAADFRPAAIEAEPPRPVEIVERPVPLPLPGQLLPPPSVKADNGPPTSRVEAANRAATREPSSAGYLNAVQVYPWTDGALYRLYAAPERVSDIALQPGEKLVAVSAGDTVRWIVGDTSSGAGAETRMVIGTVIFTGVAAATFFTLFVVPVAYDLMARRTGSPGDVARKLEREMEQSPDAH